MAGELPVVARADARIGHDDNGDSNDDAKLQDVDRLPMMKIREPSEATSEAEQRAKSATLVTSKTTTTTSRLVRGRY